MITNCNSVIITPLKRFNLVEGDVLHALKSSDEHFKGFEEAYFSKIKRGKTKAWKRHLQMTMNLIVPYGSVLFVFYNDKGEKIMRIKIGEENYSRITVAPKIWFGFIGKSNKESLILNISNIPHDPTEIERRPIDFFSFDE